MNRRKLSVTNGQILDEAATWFVSFRTQGLTDSSRQDFHEWLKRSPEHIRAYVEVAWTYVYIPTPARDQTAAELIAEALASSDLNVVALNSPAGARAGGARPPGSGMPTICGLRRVPVNAILAAVLVIGAGLALWAYGQRNTYSTAIGEQRSITLADGSIVELNACTKVRIGFHKSERDVELLYGEAYFSVAKDHSRPFIVLTRKVRVRAVGTQFDINLRSAETTVTVLEGRVTVQQQLLVAARSEPLLGGNAARDGTSVKSEVYQVTRRMPDGSSSTAVNPDAEGSLGVGEQMNVTATSIQKIAEPNVAAATGWLHHQLIFDGTPLREVIEEFRRYSAHRVAIDSPSLEDLRISGQYTSSSPDSFLRFLSLQRGIVLRDINGETHISQE